jgi:hypothetical protein
LSIKPGSLKAIESIRDNKYVSTRLPCLIYPGLIGLPSLGKIVSLSGVYILEARFQTINL